MSKQGQAHGKRKGPRQSRWLISPLLLGSFIFVLLLVAGLVGWSHWSWNSQGSGAGADSFPYVSDFPTEGNPNALVTITAFEDYHCTACHYFSTEVLPQLEEQYVKAGQVKVVFRHFVIYGQDSERAAQATECVYEQDIANHTTRFRQFHALLFEHQGSIGSVVFTRDGLRSFAEQAGVENLPAFSSCLDSGRYASKVDRSTREITLRGANGTPTILIGNQMFVGSPSLATFQQVISQQLNS